MEKLSDEQRAIIHEAWRRAKARMALQQIQQEGSERRQRIERARMSGRTIDETGKDISERQPELMQPGWYWTGTEAVWVIGTSWTHKTIYYQHKGGGGGVLAWEWATQVTHWQRVHEAVQESGQGFEWRPDSRTC